MGEIYRNVSYVVVWLGPQVNWSDVAVNFLKRIVKECPHDSEAEWAKAAMKEISLPWNGNPSLIFRHELGGAGSGLFKK